MTRTFFQAARAGAFLFTSIAFVAAAHAQKPPEPWDYLKAPAFQSAYTKALGPKARTPWLAKLWKKEWCPQPK